MARTRTRERSYKIQVANIKLRSNRRRGNSAYADIIKEISAHKISIPVKGDIHMMLRTQFADVVRIGDRNIDILYGKILKHTVLDGNDWFNKDSMEIESIDLPSNLFPNSKETDYIFIPEAHRFAIVNDRYININTVQKFLLGAIDSAISHDEQFEVFVEQDEDVFERIINAEAVTKLLVDISYSNADTGDEAYELIDTLLRESDSGRVKMEATPNQNGHINTDSRLITGVLRVAQSNGYASATIRENGRKYKIETKEHPLVMPIVCEETDVKSNIVMRIINRFRPNNGN